MAEEVEMIPVDGAEPPKANPLAKPAATKVATIKLPPVARKPGDPAPGAAIAPGLKAGLKLPPKPGLPSGLKLPPKPGAGAGLKPGLKLPTQTALKPGLKLPTKPVIRKPGATVAAAPLPKPIPKPVAAAPAAAPVAAAPAAAPVAAAPVPPPVKPMDALKTVTQKLKGITQEIPQQAILHKTGIIAEGGAMSDAQKEAAKHKTARISLSDAMGVAPVKDEAAPMKTIRIKRPINIPTPTSSLTPQPPAAAPAPAAAAAPAEVAKPEEFAADAAPAPTLTQRKTLKITRPGGSGVRPGGKFGIKRPSAAPAAAPAAPAEGAAAPADDAVADIPDLPSAPMAPVPRAVQVQDGPTWLWVLSSVLQAAACAVMGALAWFLWENTQLATFCGGLGWGS